MLIALFLFLSLLSGCATAIIPAKVKYVTLYEVVQTSLPPEAKGAVASVHTDQLALYLPGQTSPGHPAAPRICFTKAPGQNPSASPYLIIWQSLKKCGGGAAVDDVADRVTAQMGGAIEADYARMLVTFPVNSSTHPFPGNSQIEMTMDISYPEASKMYIFLYPRFNANLWDLVGH